MSSTRVLFATSSGRCVCCNTRVIACTLLWRCSCRNSGKCIMVVMRLPWSSLSCDARLSLRPPQTFVRCIPLCGIQPRSVPTPRVAMAAAPVLVLIGGQGSKPWKVSPGMVAARGLMGPLGCTEIIELHPGGGAYWVLETGKCVFIQAHRASIECCRVRILLEQPSSLSLSGP